MQTDIVLLLTGTVNTQNKFFTALNDKAQRRSEYIAAIRYYLQHFDLPVVFVENSGEDISAEFTDITEPGRLEILTFNGNDYAPELGKGLGEMRCIDHAISNATLIQEKSFVIKITGRYKILNLQKYIDFYRAAPELDLMADLTNNFVLSASGVFGFRKYFVPKYPVKHTSLLNDSAKWYFEHVLAKAVHEALGDRINFSLLKYYPKTSAISGSTGQKYKESFLHYFPRNMKYLIRYFLTIR